MNKPKEEQPIEEQIKEFIEEHSIEQIIEIYLQENCYGDIVDTIVAHINKRLNKLAKIEELMR